jgi:hypothetical protein
MHYWSNSSSLGLRSLAFSYFGLIIVEADYLIKKHCEEQLYAKRWLGKPAMGVLLHRTAPRTRCFFRLC